MSNLLRRFSRLLKMLGEISVALARRIVGGAGVRSAPTFASFDDALLFCGTDGYKQTEIVDVVVAKTLIENSKIEADGVLNLDSLRTVIGIAGSQPSKGLTVIDFGGAAGAHYTTARSVLGKSFPLRWHVVETEEMAAVAGAVLADDSVKFFSTVDSAAAGLEDVDLILASGVLPYTRDPMGTLKSILALQAKHVFVTRNVLGESNEEIITIQRSPLANHGQGQMPKGFKDREISFPVTIVPREKFELTAQLTYRIRFRTSEDKKVHRHNGETIDMFGYFLDLKA